MRIFRSITEPIRENLTWEHRWENDDKGLIACWERGREKRVENPQLAIDALVTKVLGNVARPAV